MMTRKDYILVAEILKNNSSSVSDEMLNDFILMFKNDNQRFEAVRFVNAVRGK